MVSKWTKKEKDDPARATREKLQAVELTVGFVDGPRKMRNDRLISEICVKKSEKSDNKIVAVIDSDFLPMQ